MTHIDVGTVLRQSAKIPFTDLVTRSTGAAVRKCIEIELAALGDDEVATLDFSSIGVMDFSCADEIVANLLLSPRPDRPVHSTGYVIFHGLTEDHLDAIEHVLSHHGLALVVHFADGGARLVGTVNEDERMAWDLVYAAGGLTAQALATRAGREPAELTSVLESLLARRLLRQFGESYHPLGSMQ
jgi:hypothetical protein